MRERADITIMIKAHVAYCNCLEEPADASKAIKKCFKGIGDKCTSVSVSYCAKKLFKYYNRHKTGFISRDRENQSFKVTEQHQSNTVGLKYAELGFSKGKRKLQKKIINKSQKKQKSNLATISTSDPEESLPATSTKTVYGKNGEIPRGISVESKCAVDLYPPEDLYKNVSTCGPNAILTESLPAVTKKAPAAHVSKITSPFWAIQAHTNAHFFKKVGGVFKHSVN